MKARIAIAKIRRATISRVFAILLVALVITPFTAPFSTFDLGDLTGVPSHSSSTFSVDEKADQKLVVADLFDATLVPLAPTVRIESARAADDTSLRHVRSVVLRL